MRIALIVARAENGIIGREGGLPWRISGDLKFFKATTMGKPVVMGRKTYESIGRPLPGRENIVVTRARDFQAEGVHVVNDLEVALRLAGDLARASAVEEIMVIGGAQIYAQALDRADRIYLTEVHAAPDGDARFPTLDPAEWQEIVRQPHGPEGEDGPPYDIVVLDRRRAGEGAGR